MRRKQQILNVVSNIVSILVTLLISFGLTPFLVNQIGKDAYSFVPISNNFNSYMGVLTIALTSMSSRFVTINVHKEDLNVANEYYSTSFFSNIIMASIMFVFCLMILGVLDTLIRIPVEILWDVRLLFAFMFLAFLTNLATNSFFIPQFCMNRIDISSVITISSTFTKALVVVLAFMFFTPHLYYLGIAVFSMVLVQTIFSIIVAGKIMPHLVIKRRYFKKQHAFKLLASGIWNSINNLSNVLLTGFDLVMANLLLGVSAGGTLAVAKTVPLALLSLVNAVPVAFRPYLTILYAKEDYPELIKELRSTMVLNSVLTGLPIAIFITMTDSFFKLWVPNNANFELTLLAWLAMLSLVASFSILPLTYIFGITNKLKTPSVVALITGILNILLVLTLVHTFDYDLLAIAGVSSILELLRCLIFVPIYASKCLNQRLSVFYPNILKSIGCLAIMIALFSLIVLIIPPLSWRLLFAESAIMGGLGLVICYCLMFNNEEKKKIINLFKKIHY